MMSSMLFPMAALAALTIFVMLMLVKVRFGAIKSGQTTDMDYFVTFKGDSPEPENVQKVRRNYYNLLTSPVMFYAAGATAVGMGTADAVLMYLAWAFVALRFIHSYIHITSNAVMTRFRVFGTSVLVLAAIWIRLVMLAM